MPSRDPIYPVSARAFKQALSNLQLRNADLPNPPQIPNTIDTEIKAERNHMISELI